MNLKIWMRAATQEERWLLAKKAGTSLGYLWQLAGGHSRAGIDLAKRLNKASQDITPGAPLFLNQLRPDVWDKKILNGKH